MNTPKLPPLPTHPEPRIMAWSDLEKRAIREYREACVIAAIAAQGVPDVDALAQFIREIDGKHDMGAGALAERICAWLASAPPAPQSWPFPGWEVQHPIDPDVSAELERSDWTPEEALRWYEAGRHYDTVPNGDGTSSARILDTGAVASNALKSLSLEYAESKGDVALLEQDAVVQQEPAANIWESFPAYLIDNHEGETISEEGLQRALSEMLADPKYTHPAQQAKPQPLSDEQDRALCEAYCNTASDEYFNARPQLDSAENRRIFYAGHRKAWINWQAAHGIESAACAERDARIANIERALEKAERTLTAAGYTDEGGELWKPPIGPSQSPLLDRIAELERQLAEARKDAERYRWLRLKIYIDPKERILRISDTYLTRGTTVQEMLDAAIDNAMKEQT